MRPSIQTCAPAFTDLTRPSSSPFCAPLACLLRIPSFLLTFALAELEEGRKNFASAHEAFTRLIEALDDDLTALKRSIDREVSDSLGALNASYAAAAGASRGGLNGGGGGGTGTVGGNTTGSESEPIDVAELLRGQERERQAKEREVRASHQKDVDDKERGAGLVWIMHMRFARRSEVHCLPSPFILSSSALSQCHSLPHLLLPLQCFGAC